MRRGSAREWAIGWWLFPARNIRWGHCLSVSVVSVSPFLCFLFLFLPLLVLPALSLLFHFFLLFFSRFCPLQPLLFSFFAFDNPALSSLLLFFSVKGIAFLIVYACAERTGHLFQLGFFGCGHCMSVGWLEWSTSRVGLGSQVCKEFLTKFIDACFDFGFIDSVDEWSVSILWRSRRDELVILEFELELEAFHFDFSLSLVLENGLVWLSMFWRGNVP